VPFDSLSFIFLFLPAVLFGCYLLGKFHLNNLLRWVLVGTSCIFYSCAGIEFFAIIVLTVAVNYWFICRLNYHTRRNSENPAPPRASLNYLFGAIAWNVFYLLFWKLNALHLFFQADPVAGFDFFRIGMPLGLSFITFQQLSCVVDTYRGNAPESNRLLDYLFFIFFFPQLIAGPIVRWKELIPQVTTDILSKVQYENFSAGLFVFSMGLFKKIVVAGLFSQWASFGFDSVSSPTLFTAWFSSLSYTLQIYYDFSGYSDMAVGTALLLNIKLPINFNSPYRARNIQGFWRRWHMTLSRWLRDYIYIPLGGSRKGVMRLYINILITFLLAGVWHGTGWTFVIWGGLHGVMLVVCRFWMRFGKILPLAASWSITFVMLNFSWVFFRSLSVEKALEMCHGMLGVNGIGTGGSETIALGVIRALPFMDAGFISERILVTVAVVFIFLVVCTLLFMRNSMQLIGFAGGETTTPFQASLLRAVWAGLMASVSIVYLLAGDGGTSFIYFGF